MLTFDWEAEWHEQAECRGHDASLFFSGDDFEQIHVAKSICGGCPVSENCLQFAMETSQSAGIWGGLTANERRAYRRRLRRRRRREESTSQMI